MLQILSTCKYREWSFGKFGHELTADQSTHKQYVLYIAQTDKDLHTDTLHNKDYKGTKQHKGFQC